MNAITQAPQRCPLDTQYLNPALDFPHWWQRASALVGLPPDTNLRDVSVCGVGLMQLLKRLNSLDKPHRVLLLTMACLANPNNAQWLQHDQSLHFGHLTSADLGTDVFQVLVGLLATFHTNASN